MTDQRERLGTLIDNHIIASGEAYRLVAQRANISGETLAKARRGEKINNRSLTRIESALGWEQGTAAHILAGGNPPPRQEACAPPPARDSPIRPGLRTLLRTTAASSASSPRRPFSPGRPAIDGPRASSKPITCTRPPTPTSDWSAPRPAPWRRWSDASVPWSAWGAC